MIAGIDIGKHGAIAMMEGDQVVEVRRFEIIENEIGEVFNAQVEVFGIMKMLSREPIQRVYIEYPGIMKINGAKTTAMMHLFLGQIISILEIGHIGYELIRSNEWKKFFNLHGKPKRNSCTIAEGLYPDFGKIKVKDADIAEAILIGHYGLYRSRDNGEICIGSSISEYQQGESADRESWAGG